jgi:hypothetical protein
LRAEGGETEDIQAGSFRGFVLMQMSLGRAVEECWNHSRYEERSFKRSSGDLQKSNLLWGVLN